MASEKDEDFLEQNNMKLDHFPAREPHGEMTIVDEMISVERRILYIISYRLAHTW